MAVAPTTTTNTAHTSLRRMMCYCVALFCMTRLLLIALHQPRASADHKNGDNETDKKLELIADAPPSACVAVHNTPQSREHDADRNRERRERCGKHQPEPDGEHNDADDVR